MEFRFRQLGATIIVLSFTFAVTGAEFPAGKEKGRSESASGQFIVYGDDVRERGAFCVFGEELREGLESVLKPKGRWRHPIVVQIHTTVPASVPQRFVRGQVMPTVGGFRFQLDVLLTEGFTREEMNDEMLRLLLIERMFRRQTAFAPKEEGARLLPHWMHFGILELVRYDREGTPNELYAGIMASNRILKIEEILEGDPRKMNSVTRAVFGASSAALVRALLGMDAGPERMEAVLSALPTHRGSQRELLRRIYPGLAGTSAALEKWWALEVATMGQPTAMDFLGPEQTQERLQEALTVRFSGPAKERKGKKGEEGGGHEEKSVVCRLSEYERFIGMKKEKRAEILAPNELKLMRLSLESFPLYRTIIADYRGLAILIKKGKKRGLDKYFESLDARTYQLGQRLRDVEDYLNWHEATQMSEKSRAFEDYKKAVEELRKEAPRRRDRISVFLDESEAEARNED